MARYSLQFATAQVAFEQLGIRNEKSPSRPVGANWSNSLATEVPFARANKEATARHGPAPALNDVFSDSQANHPTQHTN